MYVMGGGRDATSNEVDVYNPITNSWSKGQPFVTARRNFATDTDGKGNIWVAGGYDTSGSPTASTEIFSCLDSPCAPIPNADGNTNTQRDSNNNPEAKRDG